MTASPDCLFRPYDEPAARAARRPRGAASGDQAARAETFELVSRGDFVAGQLDTPASSAPAPLVVVVHDTGSSADALATARAWTEAGWVVARPELALHGVRKSAKLSERLVSGYRTLLAGEPLDLDTRALVQEFARQSVSDLVRCLEALSALDEVDASRVALVGLGIGAAVSCWAAPHLPTLRACVLAGEVAPCPGDPLDPVARLKDGPISPGAAFLLLSGGSNASLLDALPEPRRAQAAQAAVAGDFGAADADAVRTFLSAELG